MDAAVRWSGFSDTSSKRFLIADVNKNRLKFCQVRPSSATAQVQYEVISKRDQLPNFTAFDWSRTDEHIAAIGTAGGEAHVISLAPEATSRPLQSFPVKLQRKCNSVALGSTSLLAVGLERIRGDSSLSIFDLKHQYDNPVTPGKTIEPMRKLSGAEPITNVKFFADQPMTLLAGSSGIGRQGGNIRIFDLREPGAVSIALFSTHHVSYLSIDPRDENYFASASPSRLSTATLPDNAITIWDRRVATRQSNAANMNATNSQPVLEIKNALDPGGEAALWSLRYSGYRRGRLAALSSTGQIRMFETTTIATPSLSKPSRTGSKSNDRSSWPVKYCKQSVNLEWPNHDKTRGRTDGTHAIAFDWTEPDVLRKGHCILTMRGDRSIETRDFPAPASSVLFHPEHSEVIISKSRNHVCKIDKLNRTKSDDMRDSQSTSNLALRKVSNKATEDGATTGLHPQVSDIEVEEQEGSQSLLPLETVMIAQDIARQRCKSGYLLDPVRNAAIVYQEPALVELWETILRMSSMAKEGKMVFRNQDLSYLGVEQLWQLSKKHQRGIVEDMASAVLDRLGVSRDRDERDQESRQTNDESDDIPVKTSFRSLRSIILYLIRWFPFPHSASYAELKQCCLQMLEEGYSRFYAAILFAYAHSRPDLAVNLLRKLSTDGKLSDPALAAIIASGPSRSAVPGQRHIIEWLADDRGTQDVYLASLLRYLMTGNWNDLIDGGNAILDVRFRVGLALRFMTDEELTLFLPRASDAITKSGDLSGVAITGLGSAQGFELFQNYLQDTGDTQTATLALAYVLPHHIHGSKFGEFYSIKAKPQILQKKWEDWRAAYFWDLQRWRLFVERARFTVQHSHLAALQGKWRRAAGLESIPSFREVQQRISPPGHARAELHLRCRNCNGLITRWKHEGNNVKLNGTMALEASSSTYPTLDMSKPYIDDAVACPTCGTKVARCSICQHWLGADMPTNALVQEPAQRNGSLSGMSRKIKYTSVAGMLCFCTRCGHAYHAEHAKEWFAKWTVCAVPDCDCVCFA